jgi:hypothetical protein
MFLDHLKETLDANKNKFPVLFEANKITYKEKVLKAFEDDRFEDNEILAAEFKKEQSEIRKVKEICIHITPDNWSIEYIKNPIRKRYEKKVMDTSTKIEHVSKDDADNELKEIIDNSNAEITDENVSIKPKSRKHKSVEL